MNAFKYRDGRLVLDGVDSATAKKVLAFIFALDPAPFVAEVAEQTPRASDTPRVIETIPPPAPVPVVATPAPIDVPQPAPSPTPPAAPAAASPPKGRKGRSGPAQAATPGPAPAPAAPVSAATPEPPPPVDPWGLASSDAPAENENAPASTASTDAEFEDLDDDEEEAAPPPAKKGPSNGTSGGGTHSFDMQLLSGMDRLKKILSHLIDRGVANDPKKLFDVCMTLRPHVKTLERIAESDLARRIEGTLSSIGSGV